MKITTDNYKGVRDFYPEDKFIQNYIFNTWRKTVSSFGYEEYDASILESTDLYKAKSGAEIVNEQTYTFIDRGEREVTLRPEMTPSLARMIAKRKRELVFPLRWFSIPNLFRYEQPQKGRLREHWQLNVDIFGVKTIDAEMELLNIAYNLMINLGFNDTQFEIKINDRKILKALCDELGLDTIKSEQFSRLLDKKKKIKNFDEELEKLLGKKVDLNLEPNETVTAIIEKLRDQGISNISFDPTITRGFDYYTDFVFEVYDTGKENIRSIFGGGRYDNLLDIFGVEKVPAVGFGKGDVTIKDMLETYGLLPEYISSAKIALCPISEAFFETTTQWANELRSKGINVLVDYSAKKIGDLIKNVDKRKIPFVAVIGENEIESKILNIKELLSGEETKVQIDQIENFLKKN